MSDDEAPPSGIARRIELSIRFMPLMERAIEALALGDISGYLALLSPNLLAEYGEDEIQQIVAEDFVSFFQGTVELAGQTTIRSATDAYDNSGIAIYKFAVSEQGERRPFAIWIVEEAGQPVVAGLLPGATYQSSKRSVIDSEPESEVEE